MSIRRWQRLSAHYEAVHFSTRQHVEGFTAFVCCRMCADVGECVRRVTGSSDITPSVVLDYCKQLGGDDPLALAHFTVLLRENTMEIPPRPLTPKVERRRKKGVRCWAPDTPSPTYLRHSLLSPATQTITPHVHCPHCSRVFVRWPDLISHATTAHADCAGSVDWDFEADDTVPLAAAPASPNRRVRFQETVRRRTYDLRLSRAEKWGTCVGPSYGRPTCPRLNPNECDFV